jgi:hypothetical protein
MRDPHAYADEAELGMRLALRALSLIRAGADPDAAVVVLTGLASNNARAVALARARCVAAMDQGDPLAGRALSLLDEVQTRMGD